MSKTYRIHGARYLRKYSAAEKSSCYSYMADVRKIANTLCTVPWERVSGDIQATTTIHTEEGLDWNEPERDRFDAAEWCGEHSDGYHRAFAQAACYVFKLPDSAVGKSIEGLRVNVTSDPYNPYGARIAAMTSATLDIPMDCDTVRQGEMFRGPDEDGLGAAPRIFVKDTKTGKETWYSNNEIVELTPGETLTAKRYLFVFVCLENYNRGRDGWIEGSSYIDNDVEITLSAAASDFDEDEINDCSAVVEPFEFKVVDDGVLPDMNGSVCGVVSLSVLSDGTKPTLDENGVIENLNQLEDSMAPGNIRSGVASLYGRFAVGEADVGEFAIVTPNRKRLGAGFAVRQGQDISFAVSTGVLMSPKMLTLTAASLVIPFAVPDGHKISSVNFDWTDWLLSNNPSSGSRFNVWIKIGSFVADYPGDTLKKAGIYNATAKEVDGWSLMATVDSSAGTTGNIPVDFGSARVASVLITAYISPDEIENTLSAFSKGTGNIWYDSISPDSAVGYDSEIGDDVAYRPGKSYQEGDKVAILNFDFQNSSLSSGSFLMYRSGSTYIAASYSSGDVYHSTNGKTWTKSTNTAGNGARCVFGNGNIIIIGTDSRGLWYSNDNGVSWSRCVSSNSSDSDFNNGRFVSGACRSSMFVSVNYYVNDAIYYSTDGVTWTKANGFEASGDKFDDVTVGGTTFVVGGWSGLYASTNGNDWTKVCNQSALSPCYCGNKFLAGSENYAVGLWYSLDGLTWTRSNVTSGSFSKQAFSNGLYVAVGCSSFASNAHGIYWSEDGITWTQSNITNMRFGSVCGFENCWVAVRAYDSDGIFVSTDGKNWVQSNVRTGSNYSESIICVNGLWMVGVNGVKISDSPGYYMVANKDIESAPQIIDRADWGLSMIGRREYELYSAVKARFHGRGSLMVPDITLIG